MPSGRRVLMVVNDASFFLSHRLPLALGARDAGFDVHIATPRDGASERIVAAGLPHHSFPLTRRGTNPLAEGRAVAALVGLFRSLRPDLVHNVTAKAILYGGIAARVARVPALVHAVSGLGHVFISQRARARVIRTAILSAYRAATAHANCAVIFQNDDDRRMLARAIGAARVVMIPGSGVDLDVFRQTPLPTEKPIVAVPSRLLWEKGIGEFVEAARILRRGGVDARFVLVGGIDLGNPAAIQKREVDRWVADGVVEWWGMRTDMPAVLAQSTIVCLPSYREGMPKALLEACGTGRPIVTTDVPGCRDVLRPQGGEHGVLVPVRDPLALADALKMLLADPRRLERMARASAAAASEFAFPHILAKTTELYRSLLSREA